MHLFTATDPKYFHHATALLASWSRFHPGCRMFVFGVGLEKGQVRALELFGATVLAEGPPQMDDWGGYIVCQRFIALREALPRLGDGSALLFDADTIVRAPLTQVSDLMSAADVGVRLRDQADENRKIYGGVLAVRNTSGAEAFLECYERHLAQRGYGWYADQWALYRAWQETSASAVTTFGHLGVSVMNRRLQEDALTWCPSQTWRKRPRFLEESLKFQRAFAEEVALRAAADSK